MKSVKTLSLFIALFMLAHITSAQTLMQRIKNTTLVFGLSEHIVVDNGEEFKFKFDTKNWQLMPFPSRITAEAYLKKGWSLQTEFAYTTYKANTIVDNVMQTKDNSFFSADLNIRYHFEALFVHQNFFDPYLTAGYGYTYRSAVTKMQTSTGTNNLGLGCNFWIYKGFGLNLQSVGKFTMKGGDKSNYLHHSIGVVYKIMPLSGKPVLKAAR
jgi:outer membrane protein W